MKKIIMILITILIAAGFIILFLACSLVFQGIIGMQKPQNIQMPQIKMEISASNNDSTYTYLSVKQIEEIKSYIDSVYAAQNSHYENALNDLRQESNNIINKWNGWFSFWLALLALLAGIIPMLMQIKVANDNERTINEGINKLEREKNEQRTELDKRQREYSESINHAINKRKEEIDALYNDIANGYKRFRMADIMNAFSIGWDNKLFTDCKERTKLLNNILAHLKELFNEYVVYLKREKVNKEQLSDVMELLIMLHGILKKLLLSYTKNYQSKKVQALIDDIEKLIIAIANKEKFFNREFIQELDDISNRFNSQISAETT